MLKFILRIALLLFICCNDTFSQSKFLPSAVRVGTDLTNFGNSLFSNERNKKSVYELNTDIDIHKYLLSFDYGNYSSSYGSSKDTFNFQAKGNYFRIGPDINLIYYDEDRSVIFFGARYGRSFFQNKLNYTDRTTSVWGQTSFSPADKNISARWFEVVGGMKVRVISQLYLGYTLRYKFARKVNGATDLTPYDIPGYGLNSRKDSFAFNYHIFWRIPFRNKPIPPKPYGSQKNTQNTNKEKP